MGWTFLIVGVSGLAFGLVLPLWRHWIVLAGLTLLLFGGIALKISDPWSDDEGEVLWGVLAMLFTFWAATWVGAVYLGAAFRKPATPRGERPAPARR